MNFEEEFPSIEPYVNILGRLLVDDYVLVEDVEKYCIDKQREKEIITGLEEEFWHIIDETKDKDAYKKAIQIKNVLLEELKLR